MKCNLTPWPESASELYRPSDRSLSANLAPTFADRGCHVVSETESYVLILGKSRKDYGTIVCESLQWQSSHNKSKVFPPLFNKALRQHYINIPVKVGVQMALANTVQ
jgi:hypothetical protein